MSHENQHRHQHGSPLKNRVIGALENGLSVAKASRKYNLPYSTVSDFWKKFQETGSTTNYHRSGQPTKLTPRTEHRIVRTARKSCREMFQEIGNEQTPKISATTVSKVLDRNGYHRRVARKKPYLNKDKKKDTGHAEIKTLQLQIGRK
ncbi:hypothetical protein C8J56DRAFT_1113209 [Mycena floridula]|nr:hypothetical protein C8J56DRAFT_1113209 [Mycena floridula]